MPESFSSECRGSLLFVYDGLVPPGGSGPSPAENLSAWLLRSGELRIEERGAPPLLLGPGNWAIPRVGTPRLQSFAPGTSMLSVCFKAELSCGGQAFLMPRHLAFPSARHPALESLGMALALSARGLLDHSVDRNASGVRDMFELAGVQAAFWAWMKALVEVFSEEGVLFRKPSDVDPRAAAVAALLEASPFGGPLPYERLEKAAGLGRVQIDRLFQRDFGMSPRGFLERRALAVAKDALLEGRLSLKELAGKLGFSSAAHFCAWFKRNAKQRPSEYRASPR